MSNEHEKNTDFEKLLGLSALDSEQRRDALTEMSYDQLSTQEERELWVTRKICNMIMKFRDEEVVPFYDNSDEERMMSSMHIVFMTALTRFAILYTLTALNEDVLSLFIGSKQYQELFVEELASGTLRRLRQLQEKGKL